MVHFELLALSKLQQTFIVHGAFKQGFEGKKRSNEQAQAVVFHHFHDGTPVKRPQLRQN